MLDFILGAAVGVVAGAFAGDRFGARVRAVVSMWFNKVR